MLLKKHELDWFAQRLNEHLDGSLMSLDDIVFYYNKLPSSVLYEGVAYRVIYCKNHENISFKLNSNKCFSRNEESLSLFIENQKFHNSFLPYKKYKAIVKGIDVNKTIILLNQYGYEIMNKFIFEEEILVLSIENMEEI